MEKEVERRKAYISQVEVEVTQLMAAMHQPPNLKAYINKKLDVFYSAGIKSQKTPTIMKTVG